MNLLGDAVQESIYGELHKGPAGNMHIFFVAAPSAFTDVPKDKCGLLKQDSYTLLTFEVCLAAHHRCLHCFPTARL